VVTKLQCRGVPTVVTDLQHTEIRRRRKQNMERSHLIVFLVLGSLFTTTWSMKKNNIGGEIVGGLPCVKRLNQLFCGSAGSSYPSKSIDKFIDDNKALLRRMYGELQEPRGVRNLKDKKRFRRDVLEGTLEEILESVEEEGIVDRKTKSAGNETASERARRQADFPDTPDSASKSGKEDVCESKVEITTPYWASNSNGKVRAVLNNKEFEQAIHQEVCSESTTPRCNRDCACEQKYKWHRLLAYDPNNECGGIFMDWFLFPSCCVCR